MADKKVFESDIEELWFKFIIYAQLFLTAIASVAAGVMMITGKLYGEEADKVLERFKGLRTLDIALGIVMILIAAFALFVRIQLTKYSLNAPMLYYILQGAIIAVSIAYPGISSAIIKQSTFSATSIITIAVSIVFLVISIIFFNRNYKLFLD